MKRGTLVLFSIAVILVLSLGVVSAGWFGDLWAKITGRATADGVCSGNIASYCHQFDQGQSECDSDSLCQYSDYDQWCQPKNANYCSTLISQTSCQTQSGCTWTATTSPADIIAPSITNQLASPSSNSALITWTTNENSNSCVEYWKGADIHKTICNSQQTSVTSHNVNITGLLPSTSYVYTVITIDSAGNMARNTNGFTTTATTSITATCTDSDGGLNYSIFGWINYTGNPQGIIREYDACWNSTTLQERICVDATNNSKNFVYYKCPDSCADGRCIKVPIPVTINTNNLSISVFLTKDEFYSGEKITLK